MKKLTIITEWVVGTPNTPNIIPLIEGERRSDITGQGVVPPDPNATVWEVYTNDLPRYEADANIFILSVEDIPDEPA